MGFFFLGRTRKAGCRLKRVTLPLEGTDDRMESRAPRMVKQPDQS